MAAIKAEAELALANAREKEAEVERQESGAGSDNSEVSQGNDVFHLCILRLRKTALSLIGHTLSVLGWHAPLLHFSYSQIAFFCSFLLWLNKQLT